MRAHLLQRLEGGRYRIGPKAVRWAALHREATAPTDALLPLMRELALASGESVALYVPASGRQRMCLHWVEGARPLRYHVREGDVLPLEAGSGGRVLAAFGGWPGEPYASIRESGLCVSLGERDPDIAGISAPVLGSEGRLFGALTIAGPRSRFDEATIPTLRAMVVGAASEGSRSLGHESDPELDGDLGRDGGPIAG